MTGGQGQYSGQLKDKSQPYDFQSRAHKLPETETGQILLPLRGDRGLQESHLSG